MEGTMTDTVADTAASIKTPLHFWIVGVIALLWNGFGGYDYTMTRMRNVEYLKMAGDPQELLAWIDSFPFWAQAAWGLGVWGSVAGSVLLLMRSRHAVSAFTVSVIGAVVSFSYQFNSSPPASLDTTANNIIPVVILVLIAFFWWYSRKMRATGVLR
jgi:hypothetical protein